MENETMLTKHTLVTITDREVGSHIAGYGAFLVQKDFDPKKERDEFSKKHYQSREVPDEKFIRWLVSEGFLAVAQCGNLSMREDGTEMRYDPVPFVLPFANPIKRR